MKKVCAWLLLLILLSGCGNADSRIGELQRHYEVLNGYTAVSEVKIVREAQDLSYTVSYEKAGESIRAAVLAPESVSGVTALLKGEELKIEYGGAVLDAGTLSPKLSAVSVVPLLLRELPKSCVTQWNEETLSGENVLRVCFDIGQGEEKLQCAAYFREDDSPLYAEFYADGKIIAAVGFTEFSFGDILPSEE